MPDSPPDVAALLIGWYAAHARSLPWRNPPGADLPADPDWPYRVWLSEIMLQQTTVAAVQPYFAAFTARWPNVGALAAADDAAVMQAWAGLGYYARARNLLACARAVVERHGGRFPGDQAALRDLPGIGDYTAAAVAAFGFGKHAIIIDGNIERVVTRLFAIATPLPAARAAIRAQLQTLVPSDAAGDFAQGLMDLAGRNCLARNPRCDVCPLRPECQGAAVDPTAFPVKAPKRARSLRHGTVWWIEAEGEVLTINRPAKGLLGGMRALPSCDWRGSNVAPPFPAAWRDLGAISHGFTHFELTLAVRGVRLPAKPALAGDWLPVAQMVSAGLPTLFEKAAQLARARLDEVP